MAPKRKAAESLAVPATKRSKQLVAAAPQASPLKRKAEEEESSAGPASKRSRRGSDAVVEPETVLPSIEEDQPWDGLVWRRDRRTRQVSLRTAGERVTKAVKPARRELSKRETAREDRAMAARRQVWVDEQKARERREEAEAVLHQQRMQHERDQEEIKIHQKMDQMVKAWTRINGPIEGLAAAPPRWINSRDAAAAGARDNPLYIAEDGRGRFYIETAEMWKDWQDRMLAAPSWERTSIAPRSYEAVKAARLDQFNQQRAENQERLKEEIRVRKRNQWRLRDQPPIPKYPPGQHPHPAANKGQEKWSKRQRSPATEVVRSLASTLLAAATGTTPTPSPPPETNRPGKSDSERR